MGWAEWAKSRKPPSAGARELKAKNSPAYSLGNHNSQVFYAVWASCARGCNFNRFADLGLRVLHKNAFGPARTCWGSYSLPPDSLAVIRGRRGREGEGKAW